MRKHFYPRFLTLWGTWFLLGVAVTAGTLQGVPLKIAHGQLGSGKPYLTCMLDGVEELCVLDTGSALSLIANPEGFEKYPTIGKVRFRSASGIPLETDQIRIETVQIDALTFPNVKFARVIPSETLESTIGIDLVGKQPFSLRFTKKPSLNLGESPSRTPLTGIEVYKNGVFSIPVELNHVQTKALWDTAAELTVVDQVYVSRNPRNFSFIKELNSGYDGTGRSIKIRLFKAKNIRIAGHLFRNILVGVLDLATVREGTQQDVQAVIGFNLIRKADWYFDLQNRRWNMK